VRAAGINFADVLVRRGRYPQMPELPAILGSEIAGELEDGTRVMAITSGAGGYAEKVAVDRRAGRWPLPDHASFAEGSSFLLTFRRRTFRYAPGTRPSRLHGAGLRRGGRCRVGSDSGRENARGAGRRSSRLAREAGCLRLTRRQRRRTVYAELPEDVGADVVVDPVGGDLFAGSFARLRPLGTGESRSAPPPAPGRSSSRRGSSPHDNVGLAGFYPRPAAAARSRARLGRRSASCSGSGTPAR